MKYTVTTAIEASPNNIWGILTDAPLCPEWNTTVERIEGQIALGNKIKVFTKLSPNRAFPISVKKFSPERNMTWSGGMPLGLFKGVRTFTLSPKEDNSTEFTMTEIYSGLLLPVFKRTIPDLGPSFEEFAAGLKSRAESVGN